MTKVFISYSHDSDAHREQVLELSDRLRSDGIDCNIDQYNQAPKQGWPRWAMQGIQQADYVLLVCTEPYRKRLELEEEQGKGLGGKWEGSLIFNILYRNETFNTNIIPLVFDTENIVHIPDIFFGYDYYDLSQPRGYVNLYRHCCGELSAEKPPLGKPRYTRTIYSNSLPTVEGKLFGRTDEIALLDKAWANPQTHVVQFVASGGTGKTKLLKHWLDINTDSIRALIAWSFYSQGSSENKQISATPFFSHVFRVLKSEKTQFNTEEEKGEHLAHLLRQRRCLLVLDGLEPLQHAGKGMRGELKDLAIRQLLKSLAGEHNSLCIVTTRIAVHELSDRAHVISNNLQNLAPQDGVSLLKSWQVHGSEIELEKAVHEYGCHALAIHLLGNALHTYLDGDVRKRDTLIELIDDYDAASRHAFKVMHAYSRWLESTPDLQLLHLLGLFDHPIETEVLQVLWRAQIPDLTAGIPEKAWKVAIRDLRDKHRMLSAHEGRPDLLDCHPLIREYFGKQLQTQNPGGWQQAHALLYEYYKALPEKEFPDTLEEMQPLFSAVAHGCAAELDNIVINDIYRKRIQHNNNDFLLNRFGAFGDNLSVISNFFIHCWSEVTSNINEEDQAEVLNWTGFSLLALGRLDEATIPMKTSINMLIHQEDWKNAARGASNLSEVQLISGDIDNAIKSAELSVYCAEKSNDTYCKIIFPTTLADAFTQAGKFSESHSIFQKCEIIYANQEITCEYICSVPGYQYCDLLLSMGNVDEVITRAKTTIKWAEKQRSPLLASALDKLMLIRADFQKNQNSVHHLPLVNEAVDSLKIAGQKQYILFGFIFRASILRYSLDFLAAHKDLQEVYDVAEPSGMRLFLADYHLEMARLLFAAPDFDFAQRSNLNSHDDIGTVRYQSAAEGNTKQALSHIEAAAKLIKETGYHRRDAELAELQGNCRNNPQPISRARNQNQWS